MASKRPEVLLLVGMSGAGRSSSSNVFEDLGYYVIENLPADLVESVVQSNDVTETNKQLVLTIGNPHSNASTNTFPNPSLTELKINKSADLYHEYGLSTWPGIKISSFRFNLLINECNWFFKGPSPKIVNWASSDFGNNEKALIKHS